MRQIRTGVRWLERVVRWIGGYLMVIMVAIVTWQVFARYVLHHTPAWSEEIVLMLMMWFGFLSIAAGFRHGLHLKINILMDHMPRPVQRAADVLTDILVVVFGVMLAVEGAKFVGLTWAAKLPVTQLPQGMQYLIIPLAGVLVAIYGLMNLLDREGRNEP
ncbi:MAG: TRAP transporter small permease [Thermoflavifilum sp.]|nr:TRAP transporter small permease [Thermoflavifilum sp.]MCL6513795.1 TRAP transporter small permease [Alicyclobacillus sp.]